MIFGKNYSKPKFYIKGEEIEVVNSFKYLGITFSKNGRFLRSLKENTDKARKAFYSLMNHCKDRLIPLDCKLELFSKCIEPILLYGCEIWGIENPETSTTPSSKGNRSVLCIKKTFRHSDHDPSSITTHKSNVRHQTCTIS